MIKLKAAVSNITSLTISPKMVLLLKMVKMVKMVLLLKMVMANMLPELKESTLRYSSH